MPKIARFIIWICSKFTRLELEQIITGFSDVLSDRNPEVKPKDDFKEKHPNYRAFSIDPLPPLTEPPVAKQPPDLKDYKLLLSEHQNTYGKAPTQVKHRSGSLNVPQLTTCPCCNAPYTYIYSTTASRGLSSDARSVNIYFKLTRDSAKIVFPISSALIVTMRSLPGNNVKRSLSTNAVTITVLTGYKPLIT